MSRNIPSRLARWLPVSLAIAGFLMFGLPEAVQATVPGQNGRIAFQSDAGGPTHLAVVNPDGAGVRPLAFAAGQAGDPAWSPDGTHLAFVSQNGGTHLRIMDFVTGATVPLTSGSGLVDSNPSWSPDGSKIAFTRCGGTPSNCEVYSVNSDGTAPVNLTNSSTSDDGMPAWSPDGTKIAFSTNRDGNAEIYVMDSDGTDPFRLTDTPEEDLSPDWSPDGTHLVFARQDDQQNSQVWSMNADGTGAVSLGEGGEPTFSPDGTRIAFVLSSDANLDLWVMNADGSSPVALVESPALESAPSWQAINPGENVAPTADAGLDATFICESEETAAVLDGTASTDPDSTPGTNDDIVLYEWWTDFGLATESFLGTGPVKDQLGLASGTYTVTLQVTDSVGQADTDEVVIIIDDQTPPEITLDMSRSRLWPPNHRLVPLRADVEAFDFCGPVTTATLKSITSNEPENSTGDGNTAPDIAEADLGTADFRFLLRAERAGNGDGRIYTVTYESIDPSGNIGSDSAEVVVPHDQRNKGGQGSGSPPGKGKGKGKGKGNGHGKH